MALSTSCKIISLRPPHYPRRKGLLVPHSTDKEMATQEVISLSSQVWAVRAESTTLAAWPQGCSCLTTLPDFCLPSGKGRNKHICWAARVGPGEDRVPTHSRSSQCAGKPGAGLASLELNSHVSPRLGTGLLQAWASHHSGRGRHGPWTNESQPLSTCSDSIAPSETSFCP